VRVAARNGQRHRALRERCTRTKGDDVGPGENLCAEFVGRVHQVVRVQRRDSGAQGHRQKERRDVGEPDEPGRVRRGDRTPVQQWQQIDGGLATARRNHRPDARVGEHGHELRSSLFCWSAGVRRPIHALANDNVIPAVPDRPDRMLEMVSFPALDAFGGRCHAHTVARPQRGREPDCHALILIGSGACLRHRPGSVQVERARSWTSQGINRGSRPVGAPRGALR
jgi:hypothetical protein